MSDVLDPDTRRATMRAVRSRDTAPEMTVRHILFQAGYRYRLHNRELPGRPDIVFSARRRVVFVHGCFWHQHPGCPSAARPATNRDYWDRKLDSNTARDQRSLAALRLMGWESIVVWECEVRIPTDLVERLAAFLGPTRSA